MRVGPGRALASTVQEGRHRALFAPIQSKGGCVLDNNLELPRPDGREMINVHQPYELRDWAIYFSVSPDKIKAAVLIVGPAVEDVKRYLGK